MSFKFSLVVLIALSLLTGFLLFRFAAFLTPPERSGAYAVLILDDGLPDRRIRDLLNDKTAISESSPRVLLDGFTGLESIPLDEYSTRVSSFDPRNDGYAERIRAFFVRAGKRFVYIPLGRGSGAGGRLEKRIADALGEIPFQLEYSGGRRPAGLYLFLMAAAGAGALWFTRRLTPAPCIPALAGLALTGTAGVAAAAFFMGLGGLLMAPGREYFMQLRYKKNRLPFGAGENRPLGETLGPFRKRLFWAPLLLGGLVACSIPGGVHPLLILGTGIGFMGIYLFSHWVFSRRGEAQDHVRFSPVLILKIPAFNRELSRFMLPHALAALLGIPLSLAFSGPAPVEGARFLKDAPPPVRDAEYRAHAAFQASFSFRSLGQNPQAPVQGPAAGEAEERAYFRYVLGDDGLIAGNAPARSVEAAGHDMNGIPPFTLGDLMEALEPGNGSIRSGRGPAFGELLPVFAALLLSLPALLRFRREDKPGKNRLVYKEKEIAA